MSLVNISSYSVSKKNGEGGSGGGSTNINVTSSAAMQAIEIWGQMLDLGMPEDITGDFRIGGGA